MRKELLWAIGVGIFFGIIIAFGVWRVNSSLTKNPGGKATPTPNTKNSSFKIVLDSPENEDVITESTVSVSGITTPLSYVIFSGEDADYIVYADERGNFKGDVDLTSGVNQIKITVFDPKGAESGTHILVVYSSAFTKRGTPTDNPNIDSSSESAIRAKVEEKVKEALTRPKAYLGTVTDIADSTIQIKSLSGEIKQISVKDGGVTVIKSGTTNKEVKLTDIGIGDFIVGMGYKNGNQVLSSQRILITDQVTEPSSKATLGTVSAVDKKTITIGDNTITPDKGTAIYSLSDGKVRKTTLSTIEAENLVIYVTVTSSDKTTLRSVFVLQKS